MLSEATTSSSDYRSALIEVWAPVDVIVHDTGGLGEVIQTSR